MLDITLENFESQVIHASMKTPVLIDFWASWCMPCASLGPTLEKLESEYGGRFILTKIDVEAQPQLAQAFGIRSVPTVVLLFKGQPVDGFAGAISEGEVKAFLDKHLPSEEDVQAKTGAEQAAELAQSGDTDVALAQLKEVLDANPGDVSTRCQYIELLLQAKYTPQAREAWQPLAPLLTAGGNMAARPAALQEWIAAQENDTHTPEQLRQQIEQDKCNFQARYALAQHWFAANERTQALDELLEIIMRDKTWQDGAARKLYVGILELMTPQKTQNAQIPDQRSAIALERQTAALDPQQQLVLDYRRQLSMVLN